jgi:HAUS augmin-like complex subunit 6 N-terminus
MSFDLFHLGTMHTYPGFPRLINTVFGVIIITIVMMHAPPVTIFLRNLTLLQLDQQPDWPNLSGHLFAGGQQTQRQRVKGVEWALYHLFNMWDPDSTRNVCVQRCRLQLQDRQSVTPPDRQC